MKIYFIRHGETTSDTENRFGGEFDDHLTNKGMFQAEEIAFNLSDAGITAIYSSPKSRAKETADILARTLKCDVAVVEDLKESSRYGILTGMNKEEAKLKYPDQVALTQDFYSTIIGGEQYSDFKRRVENAIEKIISESKAKHKAIAIVSHGGPMRVAVREILRMGELTDIGHGAIITIDVGEGKMSVKGIENATLEKRRD
jgi:broad specificity phosphatase PhoE